MIIKIMNDLPPKKIILRELSATNEEHESVLF